MVKKCFKIPCEVKEKNDMVVPEIHLLGTKAKQKAFCFNGQSVRNGLAATGA